MKQYVIVYFATLIVMTCLDMAWIGGVAKDFYKTRMGDLLEFHAVPGVIFYLMYAVAIVIFVNGSPSFTWHSTMLFGALFGLFCYATYDLTNLATLRGWSLSLAIVDIAWGTLVTAVSATAGRLITNYFVAG